MPPPGLTTGIQLLRWHDENRHAAETDPRCPGNGIVGITSNTVPRELIAAAGFFPLMLSPQPVDASAAAEQPPHATYMEDAFDARTRDLFDFLVSGRGAFLKAVIIPRTSEREHKLFLYLKEIQRREKCQNLPPLYLYNLLHTRTDESLDYSRERTADLKRFLETLAGKAITSPKLHTAIIGENAARQAARRLQSLREGPRARLWGELATRLLRARYFLDAPTYNFLAEDAAKEIEARTPIPGPRVLLKGASLPHSALHHEIESHGTVVFAEDDPWGARSATNSVPLEGDHLEAIVSHYHTQETSPRVPLPQADQWFHDKAEKADAVVFYLPPEDDVLGWDYPRQRQYLDERNIPHTLVRADAAHLDQVARDRLGAFFETLAQRHAHHG